LVVGNELESKIRSLSRKGPASLVRVIEDWCRPFPGFFLYYPSRRPHPAALTALIETLRV
jgi:DNA-binding transcriptional LysR family regulator